MFVEQLLTLPGSANYSDVELLIANGLTALGVEFNRGGSATNGATP